MGEIHEGFGPFFGLVCRGTLIRNLKNLPGASLQRRHLNRGKLFYLQLELFFSQLSFFAYSPLRPLLDMHFPSVSKKAPTVSKEAKAVSKKAPIVSKKATIVNCK